MSERMSPIHPGEILEKEFMDPMDISQNELASDLSVSPRRINEIVNEKRAITADRPYGLQIILTPRIGSG